MFLFYKHSVMLSIVYDTKCGTLIYFIRFLTKFHYFLTDGERITHKTFLFVIYFARKPF